MEKKRLFSGIQPSGNLHIGNYLGAIRRWVMLQDEYESFFSVVDLHAITVPQDPRILKAKTREVAGLLLAAGIDPDRSILFVQSEISAHAELGWILSCSIPMGWMKRMTQFKEKSKAQSESVSVGLFAYPALMAADILLYQTDIVPIGEDQKQHLELTRDAAHRFNSIYGATFKLPTPIIPETGARIMGLGDPERKMSKSERDESQAVYLLDPPGSIRSKIMKATTDSLREVRFDEARQGINNLLVIYQLLSGLSKENIESRFENLGYKAFKEDLAEVIIEVLTPLQSRYRELMEDGTYLDSLLIEGTARARPIAQETLVRVKERVGLGLSKGRVLS